MKPKTEQQLREELQQSFDRWDHLLIHGCQDPFWPDGVNMNLVRNHIIWYYKQLEEISAQPVQLSLFNDLSLGKNDRPVPPKVPDNYMAPKGDYPNRPFMRSNPNITHDSGIKM